MFKELPDDVIEKILEQVQVGLTLVDHEGKIIYFNSLAGKLLAWNKENTENNSVLGCHPPELREKVLDKLNKIKGVPVWHRILKIRDRYIENVYSPINVPGHIKGVMIVTRDVTEREEMNSQIRKNAVTDSLTGLYNRKHFNDMHKDLLEQSKSFGIIMLDVNGLKYVNDKCGHESGDKLLVQAAGTISRCVRETDYVFRFGGDEFVVLVPGGSIRDLHVIWARIKARNQYISPDCPVGLNLSAGCCSSVETDNPWEVLNYADEAMYKDKRNFYENEGAALKRE